MDRGRLGCVVFIHCTNGMWTNIKAYQQGLSLLSGRSIEFLSGCLLGHFQFFFFPFLCFFHILCSCVVQSYLTVTWKLELRRIHPGILFRCDFFFTDFIFFSHYTVFLFLHILILIIHPFRFVYVYYNSHLSLRKFFPADFYLCPLVSLSVVYIFKLFFHWFLTAALLSNLDMCLC